MFLEVLSPPNYLAWLGAKNPNRKNRRIPKESQHLSRSNKHQRDHRQDEV